MGREELFEQTEICTVFWTNNIIKVIVQYLGEELF